MTAAAGDAFDLARFVLAQEESYARALAELRDGAKRTHWMWYIFPQLVGLGSSELSRRYGISGIREAAAYLAHPVLGPRLLAVAEAVVAIDGRSALEIFGDPDDLKLKSSATLFDAVLPAGSVFDRLLKKFWAGQRDAATLALLAAQPISR
ncbi:MAG: DUF1810 domain-containing protein [Gemmatimonadales bacterium]